MPRNASGTYSLAPSNPVVTGTIIASDWANDTMSDVAIAMTNSLSRNGNGGMLAPLPNVDGTEALPSVTFTNALSTGLYRAGAADVRTSLVGQDRFRVTTAGTAVWDTTDAVWYPLLTSKTNGNILETVNLVDAQTVVPFTQNVAGAAFFVNGTSGDRGRLLEGFDYTYDSILNEVTLFIPFPATTKLTASFRDESSSTISATTVAYSNVTSGYAAENVQTAIDESASNLVDHVAVVSDAHVATAVTYDGSTSGLGDTVQIAIDALDGIVDGLATPASWGVVDSGATLSSGQRIFADTTTGAFTLTLPSAPADNDSISISDFASTWDVAPPIVGRNGKSIMGLAEDMTLDSGSLTVTFTFVASTQDWRIT